MQERVHEFNLAIYGSLLPGYPLPIDKIDMKATHQDEKYVEFAMSCVNGRGTTLDYFQEALESEEGL